MTLKQLDKELSKIDSIPDKLDYLKKYHLKISGELINYSNNYKYKGKLSIYELVKRVSALHFPNRSQTPVFTYWFLKWNAQNYLNNIILNPEYKRKLDSNRKQDFIKSELSKLENEVNEAQQREREGLNSSERYRLNIDPESAFSSKLYLFGDKYKFIETLRMLEGNYYEHHTTEHAFNVSASPEVIAYAKHILLKDRLKGLLNPKENGLIKKSTHKRPQNFNEMFFYPESIQDCIDVLKKVEPPVLSEKETFIGTYKSSFCVWVDILKRKGLMQSYADRSVYSDLISEKFSPFVISEGTFAKFPKRAEKLYSIEFDTLLSQVSQKIKQGK